IKNYIEITEGIREHLLCLEIEKRKIAVMAQETSKQLNQVSQPTLIAVSCSWARWIAHDKLHRNYRRNPRTPSLPRDRKKENCCNGSRNVETIESSFSAHTHRRFLFSGSLDSP